MISMGVVSEDLAKALVRKGHRLAKQTNKTRDYVAIMRLFVAMTKLEIDERRSRAPQIQLHQHQHQNAVERKPARVVEIVEQLGLTELAERYRRIR